VLRSPHPPDAIPVPLDGLVLADTFGTDPVVTSDWLAAERQALRYPRHRVLFHGAEPPLRSPDWGGVLIGGAAAMLLLLSRLVGYPIFRPAATDRVRRLAAGERLQVEMYGRLETSRSRSALEGALGYVERMTLPDLEVTLWRYGQVEQGESRRDIRARVSAEAGTRDSRLVVHAPGRSVLATVGDGPVTLEPGTVHRVMHSRPALRLRGRQLDLLLLFEQQRDRDRAVADVAHEAAS
jgi:hypothetical protein